MSIAWLLAALTAIWFGLLAWRAERSWVLWAVGGALFGLLTTLFVFGLGQAASIPYSTEEAGRFHMKEIGISVLLIVVLGILFTLGLYRGKKQG